MDNSTRICKVCGVEYPYCKTHRPSEVFRWQDVACCPEHGAIYLDEILRSRGLKPDNDTPAASEQPEPTKRTSRKKKVQEQPIEQVKV